MKIKALIEEQVEAYLEDPRKLDVVGFVDQLLSVAAENGAVGGKWGGEGVQFTVRGLSRAGREPCGNSSDPDVAYAWDRPFARDVLRMMCARVGVLCRESTGREVDLYGDRAVVEREAPPQGRWEISFTNTPVHQEFLIERL